MSNRFDGTSIRKLGGASKAQALSRRPGALVLALALAVAMVALAPLAGCRSSDDTPSDRDAEMADAVGVAITGPCAEPPLMGAAPDSGSNDWAPVTVTERAACFLMSAESEDTTGVYTDTAFVLESAVEIAPEDLARLLQVEPVTAFRIEQVGTSQWIGLVAPAHAQEDEMGGEDALPFSYRVVLESPLVAGQMYRFRLSDVPPMKPGEAETGDAADPLGAAEDDEAAGATDGPVEVAARTLAEWGFQTRQRLRVVQALPGDESADVPLDAGIEMTFSHSDVIGVEDRFTIEPDVDGSFETRQRTVVFIPEALEPATLYTVRIADGVGIAGSDLTLDEPFELRFETGADLRAESGIYDGRRIAFSRLAWEQPTGDAPMMSVLVYGPADEFAGQEVEVATYRYPDLGAFGEALDARAAVPDWARQSSEDYRADTGTLALATTFDATLEPLGEYGELLLRFPEPLEAGAYLVELTFEEQAYQAWLQVTDIATYVALSDPELLVWVNDAASGVPVAGAEVIAREPVAVARGTDDTGSLPLVTDSDGVATGATPPVLVRHETHPWGDSAIPTGSLLVTAPDGRSAVVPLSNVFRGVRDPGYREMGGGGHPHYWRYLYLDRQLYRPSDTVRFWGVAQGREEVESPSEITVELVGGDYRTSSYSEAVLDQVTVPVGPTGTFTGALEYEGASPGYYRVRSTLDGEILANKSVEIGDIVKPAYQLDMSPERDAVFLGDQITMTVLAAFFEGSPVPGVALTVDADAQSLSTETDDLGRATVSYVASSQTGSGYGHGRSYASARPAVAEEGDVSAGAAVIVFPGSLALDVSSEVVGETGSISGTVRSVDLAVPDAVAADDYMTDPVPERDVAASITEVSYDRVETGEYYDFIDKVVRKQYRYDRVEQPGGELEAVSDETGWFAFEMQLAEDRSYEVDVSVTDDVGRTATRRLYLGRGPGGAPSWQTGWEAERQGPYAEGDEVELRLVRGGAPLPEGDRFLFLRARSGVRDHVVQTSPELAFAFGDGDVPNIHVLGTSFNGATYSEAPWSYNALLDSSTRELEIEVTSDRERYAPGDEVRLDVAASGPDGSPAAAEVLLSGVDAAIHSMQGDDPGTWFLSDLYAAVPSGVVRTYASHQFPSGGGGAEGGGGNGGARGHFEDVVLFETVTTDDSGHAETSFIVPDNLTSWVVSALGITDDLHGGYGAGAVPVGLPLFVDLTANESYLSVDEPVVRLRAYGEALSAGDEVSFEMFSETLMEEPESLAGEAFTGVDVPLPALVEGEHVLAVRATNGELEDVLERKITVVSSRLAATESRSQLLGPGDAFVPAPTDRRVQLVVSDGNRGRYLPDLARLAGTRGDRLDMVVSRFVAQDLETKYFGAGSGNPSEPSLEPYRTGEGGLALLPYGDPELVLSARTAAVAPETVGRQGLVQYFTSIIDTPGETRERVSVALHGLAALGEPVLPAVTSLLGAGDLEPREELYLGIAAATLGDLASADLAYRSLLEEFGEARGTTARLNVADDRDLISEATALGAVLAAALGHELAPALYQYTIANPAEDIVVAVDQADYLARALPRTAAGPVSLSYTHLGSREEAALEAGESLALSLTPEQLAELELEIIEGQAAVVITEQVPLNVADADVDPAVGLGRQYAIESSAPEPLSGYAAPGGEPGEVGEVEAGEPPDASQPGAAPPDASPPDASQSTVHIEDGDLVRVYLSYQLGEAAVDGCYQLSDLLPSGLRPVSRPRDARGYYLDEGITYPYAVDGQRVSFCVYRADQQKAFSYLARVVSKGRYAAEPALIEAMQAPESANVSAPAEVEIR